MNTGWNYDCDPNNPSGCTDWQMCLYNVYAASGTNMVHYFGDPINPYVKDNPPVDMYFLMAASQNSDGEFTYHSDQETPPYTCGDVNSDFAVNVSDAVFVINYVFIGGEAPEPLIAGDTNCDGAVNVSDAVYIINYVFIGGSEPCDTNSDGSPDC
jgi:hypothetical protein